MKAEDAVRLFNEVRAEFERRFPGAAVLQLTGLTAAFQTVFARACEQHGIERAKAHGKGNIHVQSDGIRGRAWVDWSALDAEVAKENEDG